MGMCDSVDISQDKVDDQIGDIGGLKMYINDILFLIKDYFGNHIEHLRMIFSRLRNVGLKVNEPT